MYIKKAEEFFGYTVDIRRKIHENPELSGLEDQTIGLKIRTRKNEYRAC